MFSVTEMLKNLFSEFKHLNIIFMICVVIVFYKVFVFILSKIYFNILKRSVNLKKTGQWAVVTGCTDGIGKSFTFELAKLGMDIVLISRTRQKLEDLAKELEEKYKINTKIIVVDFIHINELLAEVERELADLDIGLLINNVALFLGHAYFVEWNWLEINNMVEVNTKGVVGMCLIVLPRMVKKRKGVIINVSSMVSVVPTLYTSCYSATKAFVTKFSEDLQLEYEDYGVTVTCLVPGVIATKLVNATPGLMTPAPDTYAKSALKSVGVRNVTTGYWPYNILIYMVGFLDAISPAFTSWIYKRFTIHLSRRINTEEHKHYLQVKL